MKWYVIGSGAVGSLIGSQLTKKLGLENVVLIDKNADHVQAMQRDGLTVETKFPKGYRRENLRVNTRHTSELQPKTGNFILATKHYDTAEALDSLVETQGPIVSLQNGYNSELDRVKPRLVRGVVGFALSFVDNAHVRQTTSGEVYLGNLSQEELGALIFILNVLASSEKTRIKIGMGKPLGMGAVKIVAKAFVVDTEDRYKTLFDTKGWANAIQDNPVRVQHSLGDFLKKMQTSLGTELLKTKRIRDLLTLLQWPGPNRELTRYMEIEYPDKTAKRGKRNEYKERPVLPTPFGVWSKHSKK